jgi:hypothetical protein
MEKTLYYISRGKIHQAKYWTIFMGNHDVEVLRKFPGEDKRPIKSSVNLTMLSNGYIEGYGYTDKGKIVCRADYAIVTGSDTAKVHLDSLEYVCNGGTYMQLNSAKAGPAFIDVEGYPVEPRKMVLQLYKMENVYGEEALKSKDEIVISAFAYTKEGINKAMQYMLNE